MRAVARRVLALRVGPGGEGGRPPASGGGGRPRRGGANKRASLQLPALPAQTCSVVNGACESPLCDVRPNQRAQVVVGGVPEKPCFRLGKSWRCGRHRPALSMLKRLPELLTRPVRSAFSDALEIRKVRAKSQKRNSIHFFRAGPPWSASRPKGCSM